LRAVGRRARKGIGTKKTATVTGVGIETVIGEMDLEVQP
jgi:hypothetical protein